MHPSLIQDITFILISGTFFGWIFKKFLKLPLIIGYIFAGISINFILPFLGIRLKTGTVNTLSEIGILLLFLSIGLHFSVHKIQKLGIRLIFVSVAQTILMWGTGIKIAEIFGFDDTEALFIGAATCVTSTMVVVKVLEDFQLKSARFAEKIFGLLLIEDSVTIFLLIWLTTKSTSVELSNTTLFLKILPIFIGSIILWWILGSILVPRFVRTALHDGKEELLCAVSVALAIGLAYLSEHWKFSPALGAFIMGSIMSECREVIKIEQLIEPIKNLFGLVFFVSVGLMFKPYVMMTHTTLIISLILFVIFIRFIYNFLLNTLVGFNINDSIKMAGCLVQIGEVSFVVAQAGRTLDVLSNETYSVIVAVSIITMIGTPLFMKFFFYISEKIQFIVPGKLLVAYEAYSGVLSDFSIRIPAQTKSESTGFLKKLQYTFTNIKDQVKENYYDLIKQNKSVAFNRLAPWNDYLISVQIIPSSIVSGKSLNDLKLRETFGINVVAIQREEHFIVSPKPNDIVLSGDELIVYGNEDSIKKMEQHFLQKVELGTSKGFDAFMLSSVILTPSHPFVGKNIADLHIRSTFNCLILAINRGHERIKNPTSTFVLKSNDEIYIFGNKSSISHISSLGSDLDL